MLRIGEALHPGPGVSTFTIGTFNPTGLLRKGERVADMSPNRSLWGATETHLTKNALAQFRSELKFTSYPARVVPSHPAQPLSKAVGTIGGKAEGVCILSDCPVRALPGQWEPDIWQSSRVQAAACLMGDVWVKMGVFYGFAKDPLQVHVQEASNNLLSAIVDRVAKQSVGPRIICGDFNQELLALPQCQELAALGFVEAQQWANQAWGQEVKATCKKKTIKDFLWVSREMLPFIQKVWVDDTYFADHAVLAIEVRFPSSHPQTPIWKKAMNIEWGEIQEIPSLPDKPQQMTCEEIFTDLENRVDAHLRQSGSQGLLPSQKGRCKTTEVSFAKHTVTPLRQGRQNEYQLQFLGGNFQHVRWCRQLRRLQSYVALTTKPDSSPHKWQHRCELWASIRKATGFGRSFELFWYSRPFKVANVSDILPLLPPPHEVALGFFLNFQAIFSSFEKALIRERTKLARQRRSNDPNVIFKDLARPRSLPVQTILSKSIVHVSFVSTDHKEIEYTPVRLDTSQPVFGPMGMLMPDVHEAGKLTFRLDPQLQTGDTIVQQKLQGELTEVFDAFHNLWSPRWNKHCDTGEDRWRPFAEFVLHEIPKPSTQLCLPEITVQEWKRVVRSKKASSATGPDGISKADLVHMPDDLTNQLVRLFNSIEQGLPWPKCLLTGLISAIEKTEHAQGPSDYRPISVLSMAYRVWGTIRSRQILTFLSEHAPPGLLGNKKGASTSDVWWKIACEVEESLYFDSPLSGAVTDVVKCFNALPRVPVMLLAHHIGIPPNFLHTWLGAVSGIERRFTVNGATSPAIRSCTGFPEGCPLSVVACFLINIAFHKFLTLSLPGISVWSYVDNWETTSDNVHDTDEALGAMLEFTQLIDVELDGAKSFVWSTHATERAFFKLQGHQVLNCARDLGGHLNYNRQNTLHTIRARLVEIRELWVWLAKSCAPLPQKLKALECVAWPRCLHSIPTLHIAEAHFCRLRSAAVRSMHAYKHGVNPMLHLSLVCPTKYDPEFFALWATLKMFRKHCNPDVAFPLLTAIVNCGQRQFLQGPCGALLSCFATVAWTWEENHTILDHEGLQLHLLHTPIQVLKTRLMWAWQLAVGSKLCTRDEFMGMQYVDRELTMQKIDKHSSEDQGLLRIVFNGTFFTRDKLHHNGYHPNKDCPFCGGCDGVYHRHWECPHFRDLHPTITPKMQSFLDSLPDCLIFHGWCPRPFGATTFSKLLDELPDLTGHFATSPGTAPVLHLFTDGTCEEPQSPTIRLAAWGVAVADMDTGSFSPVSQGPVCGQHQTILRAEILGAISAFRYAIFYNRNFMVWTDNQRVFEAIQQFSRGGAVPDLMSTDHDLWGRLHFQVTLAVSRGLFDGIVKVRSHEDPDVYPLVERWAIEGNDFADSLAQTALRSLPGPLIDTWQRMKESRLEISRARDILHKLFIDVGQRALRSEQFLE